MMLVDMQERVVGKPLEVFISWALANDLFRVFPMFGVDDGEEGRGRGSMM